MEKGIRDARGFIADDQVIEEKNVQVNGVGGFLQRVAPSHLFFNPIQKMKHVYRGKLRFQITDSVQKIGLIHNADRLGFVERRHFLDCGLVWMYWSAWQDIALTASQVTA